MKRRYEYQFVRLGEGVFGVKKWAKEDYPDVVQKYAEEGWRLIQIFRRERAATGRQSITNSFSSERWSLNG